MSSRAEEHSIAHAAWQERYSTVQREEFIGISWKYVLGERRCLTRVDIEIVGA
jgi:hypothetical protein